MIVCQAVWILVMIISHKYRTYGVLTSSKVAKVVVFFLACKLFTSHVNQLITPSIVIISQVVPLEQISTLYQMSATYDTKKSFYQTCQSYFKMSHLRMRRSYRGVSYQYVQWFWSYKKKSSHPASSKV